MKQNTIFRTTPASGLLSLFVAAPLLAKEAKKVSVKSVVYGMPLVIMGLTKQGGDWQTPRSDTSDKPEQVP